MMHGWKTNQFFCKHWSATSRMISQIIQNTYLQGMEYFKTTGEKKKKRQQTLNPETVLKGK